METPVAAGALTASAPAVLPHASVDSELMERLLSAEDKYEAAMIHAEDFGATHSEHGGRASTHASAVSSTSTATLATANAHTRHAHTRVSHSDGERSRRPSGRDRPHVGRGDEM